MKTYISTFSEFDRYKKILKDATASDVLVLFTETEDPLIPFSMFDMFRAAKCKVNITTYDPAGITGLDKSEYLYFLMGKIAAESKDVEILSANPVLTSCKQIIAKSTAATKRKTTKAVNTSKADVEKTADIAKEVVKEAPKKVTKAKNIAEETTDKIATTAKAMAETLKEAVKEKTEKTEKVVEQHEDKSEEDKKLDEQYEKLTEILTELKTDDFDPSTQIYNIVSAVKLMTEEKITFEKAIKQTCSPLVANKLYKAIKGKKTVIANIIKEML